MAASVVSKKTFLVIALSAFIFVPVHAFGDDTSGRAKLIGSWQPQDPGAKESGAWTFEQKGNDRIRVSYTVKDQKVFEFECNTTGMDCEVKDSGKSAKVSMWYIGSKLVELETKGSEVVKRRFGVGDGDSLEVETIPVQPNGQTEKVQFRRVSR